VEEANPPPFLYLSLFMNFVEVEFSEVRFHHREKLCILHPHITLFPRPSTGKNHTPCYTLG
jgi:hypothetical protein